MNVNTLLHKTMFLVAVFAFAVSSQAAEIRLRQQCSAQNTLVKLGDIAEVYSTDAAQADSLKQIELFPSPNADQPRIVRFAELQELLSLRGVNLAEHRISGSSTVQINSEKKKIEQPLSDMAVKRVDRRVKEAIAKYLQEQSSVSTQRTLEFELTAAQQRAVSASSLPLKVRGGKAPWDGTQKFTLTVDAAEGPFNFSVEARVKTPSMVVAAVRSLPRGAIIRAGDVNMVHGNPGDGDNGSFASIEEVIGKQTTKVVAEGKILAPDVLQSPLMVRRGDVVTVYARSAGIRIHTTARAKDDGATGDLVSVETMTDRKQFTARVSGPRELEVFAQAATAP
jgi:flagella basal body P-ring formation protein FlgA